MRISAPPAGLRCCEHSVRLQWPKKISLAEAPGRLARKAEIISSTRSGGICSFRTWAGNSLALSEAKLGYFSTLLISSSTVVPTMNGTSKDSRGASGSNG